MIYVHVPLTHMPVSRQGGGIYVGPGGEAVLTDTEIHENTAKDYGGGVYVALDGEAILTNTNIHENIAGAKVRFAQS